MGTIPDPEILRSYERGLSLHGETLQGLGWGDDYQKLWSRHRALTAPVNDFERVLDFGCGLGHLAHFLGLTKPGAVYVGCDTNKDFVKVADARRGCAAFHITRPEDINGNFDHIVACGVFNRFFDEPEGHALYIQDTIEELLRHATVGVHVDFLRDGVDFQSATNFHMPIRGIEKLMDSLDVSRFSIDASYLPYEFCVHIFKDEKIERPRNVYANAL